MRFIVCFSKANDDYGVYVSNFVNEFGTPLAFRGTLDECIAFKT